MAQSVWSCCVLSASPSASWLASARACWHLESSASTAERPEPVCRFKVKCGKAESNYTVAGPDAPCPERGGGTRRAASVWPTCRVDPWRRCGPLRYSTVRSAPEEKESAVREVFSFPPVCSVCRSRVGWASVRGGGFGGRRVLPCPLSFVCRRSSPPLVVLAT